MSEQIGLWRATYTPGQWVVLAGPTSLVILRPAPSRFSTMINSFWDVVVEADSLDDLVRRLAQYNVERMPDFAAFFWHDGEMRSLVRGALQVVDLESGDTIATGEGVQTWTESGLGEVRRVRVVMEQEIDPESELRLPLVVGAVSASAVDLDAEAPMSSPQRLSLVGGTDADREDHPPEAEAAEAEVDAGVGRQSVEDRVANLFGSGSDADFLGTGAGGFGAGAAAAAGAAAGAAGTAFEESAPGASTRPSANPPPVNPFGQPPGQGPFGPGPGSYGPPGRGPGQQGPGGQRPGQGGPLYPPTEAFTPGFAHEQHPGGQPHQGFQPSHGFPPQQPYDGPQQPSAYGQGSQGSWKPVSDHGQGEPSGEMVLAVTCPQGHPNAPEAQRCRRCGGPLQGQPRMVPRPVMALLRPSTGAPVEVDRSVLIGRSPQANRVARDQLPKLLTVPSPSHDISRTHVQVSPDGWDLVAIDLHSTNGTLLIRPGHPEPERMAPGEPMAVYPGCVLDLGDGVTILVDHPV